MSGMLTVVGNPRRRRRNRRRTKTHARKHHRRLHAKATRNPRRRRRVHARRHVARRRRHHNPILSGGVVGVVTKGLTLGLGAVSARLVANAVNNLAFKDKALTGLPKIGLEAAVGAGGWFALKSLKQGAFANAFATGAGIVVALDLYDLYVKGMLPAMLQDYAYGNLNDYQYGALNGWAPQPGLEAGMSGGNVYDGGVY
jgi:hypothetical protein